MLLNGIKLLNFLRSFTSEIIKNFSSTEKETCTLMGIHMFPVPSKVIQRKKKAVFDGEVETTSTKGKRSEGIPQGI
jgi:hypothetical protein